MRRQLVYAPAASPLHEHPIATSTFVIVCGVSVIWTGLKVAWTVARSTRSGSHPTRRVRSGCLDFDFCRRKLGIGRSGLSDRSSAGAGSRSGNPIGARPEQAISRPDTPGSPPESPIIAPDGPDHPPEFPDHRPGTSRSVDRISISVDGHLAFTTWQLVFHHITTSFSRHAHLVSAPSDFPIIEPASPITLSTPRFRPFSALLGPVRRSRCSARESW